MADAVVNGKVQPKRTKAMDMRFHWLRDRECQEQFHIYWRPGKKQLCQLLDQASLCQTSPTNLLRIHYSYDHTQDALPRYSTPTIQPTCCRSSIVSPLYTSPFLHFRKGVMILLLGRIYLCNPKPQKLSSINRTGSHQTR
jgi:hypothetical protein